MPEGSEIIEASSMKIALINNLYPPYIIGGNEILAHDVVEELRRRGHIVHVVVGKGRDLPADGYTHGVLDLDLDRKNETFLGEKQPTPVDIFNWHLFNHKSYKTTKQLLQFIKPDLVIVWNLYMASMAPLVAASKLRIPTVIHVCDKWLLYSLKDLEPLLRPSTIWQRLATRLLRETLQKALYRMVDLSYIISISHFIRDKYTALGFPEDAFRVIHLGIPTDLFAPVPKLPKGKINFLYVGGLWEGKGPQVAIRALGHLVHQSGMTNVHLDCYGEGTENFKRYLQGIIKQQGVGEYVSFHGFVERDKIVKAYQTHDILVFPSIWDEPFAAVPIEAMSCGMAIIATTAGGTPEAIEDEVTGLLVPPNDPVELAAAMKRLAMDGELRSRLGRTAAAVARKRFDFTTYVDKLEECYEQVIHRSKQRGGIP